MNEARIVSWVSLLWAPLIWTSVQGSQSLNESLSRSLGTLLLGALPFLGAALFWHENFHPEDALTRFGRSRRGPVLTLLARSLLSLISVSVLASSLLIFSLRGPTDPRLMSDLLATASIAIAGGISLGCLLAAARAWLGKIGLSLLVLLTWFAGQSDLPVRIALPAGHLRTLLGIGGELPFPGWVSLAALYGLALLSSALLIAKVPR